MTKHPGTWPAGTPCWVDIMVKDLPRSQAFYADVLGWDYTQGDPEQYGGYCNAQHDGALLAGLSPTMEGMEDAPNVWTVYLATDDLEATQAAAERAGAKPLVPPMEIPPFGSMGIWMDPAGAAFGVWQSAEHTGFDESDTPGSVSWCDLMTTDYEGARAFYGQLFDYSYEEMDDEGTPYSMFTVPGAERAGGGIGAMREDAAGMPPAWTVTFQVEDTDAAAERVRASGGSVMKEPWDFDWGRICLATGPDGEPFGLFTPSTPMGDKAT